MFRFPVTTTIKLIEDTKGRILFKNTLLSLQIPLSLMVFLVCFKDFFSI